MCNTATTPTLSETRPHPTSPDTHVPTITLIMTDSTEQNRTNKTLIQPNTIVGTFYYLSSRNKIITRMDEKQMSMKTELSAFTGHIQHQKQKVNTLTIVYQYQQNRVNTMQYLNVFGYTMILWRAPEKVLRYLFECIFCR